MHKTLLFVNYFCLLILDIKMSFSIEVILSGCKNICCCWYNTLSVGNGRDIVLRLKKFYRPYPTKWSRESVLWFLILALYELRPISFMTIQADVTPFGTAIVGGIAAKFNLHLAMKTSRNAGLLNPGIPFESANPQSYHYR